MEGKDAQFDLVVIGAGSAGVRAARAAAGKGARVAVCELPLHFKSSDKGGGLGGTCILRGCVPKKLMLIAAKHGSSFSDAEAFGWHIDRQPDHDWAMFMKAKREELLRLSKVYGETLAGTGVVYKEGWAKLVAPQTIQVNGEVLKASNVLIATGTKPTVLNIPGSEFCSTSDDMLDLPSRPRRVAIVGSGYIGIEFAGMLARFGADVHIVTRDDMPLKHFDNEVRAFLAHQYTRRRMTLHPHTEPVRVIEQEAKQSQAGPQITAGRKTQVNMQAEGYLPPRKLTLTAHCTDTGQELSICDLDMVLVATGRSPRTKGLGLEELGVKLNKKGGVETTPEKQSVNTPWLYAIGDVANAKNLTPVALMEGEAIASTLFDGKTVAPDYEGVPSAVFGWPEFATVGLTEEEAAEKYDRVDVYSRAFRPMYARICARSTRCAETGGSIPGAVAGPAPMAVPGCGAGTPACCDSVASVCAVSADGHRQDRAPAGPENQAKKGEEQAFVKVLVDRASNRVIGIHMVEASAPEVMQGFAAALKAGLTKTALDSCVGIHPTSAEELVQMKRPSRMVGKKAGQPEEEEKEPTSNMEKIMRNMNLKA